LYCGGAELNLHIWGMSTMGKLHEQFWIEHITIQVEQGNAAHPCRLAGDDAF
jgi:hypothetical protein